MRSNILAIIGWLWIWPIGGFAAEPVPLDSPGFPPSTMNAAGQLVEDWGAVAIRLAGEGIVAAEPIVEAVRLDELVPAARAVADHGAVRMTSTAFRAPAFPAGVDVLTVRLEDTDDQPTEVTMAVDLPAGSHLGASTVRLGGRTILVVPAEVFADQELLPWGYCDEAATLPGWGKPAVNCDPAFRNIRAGMGGVPIVYRFSVVPGSEANVVLGFCESHWAEPGRRPLSCRAEGAASQQVDPVGRWGRHQPGAIVLAARDQNSDGRLDIVVQSASGASDRNPILNALWIFPAGNSPDLEQVIGGKLNTAAEHYVDVGGENDQSIYPAGKLEYRFQLPGAGSRELTFLVASPGGSAPQPDSTAWTPEKLRAAARDVWRDWP